MSDAPSRDSYADFLRVAAVRTLGDPMLTPGEARFLLALRGRDGKTTDVRTLHDLVPPTPGRAIYCGRSRDAAIFRVWASRIRSKTYTGAVRALQGHGYWLDPAMVRSIDAVTQ